MLYGWRFSRYSIPTHWLVHGHMTSNTKTVSRLMPWTFNIAKTVMSNGKQFTVTREMFTAVARISARYSKAAFVLFCCITNHLMTGPLGKSEFCFPRISMFPSTSSREKLRFSGNKIHCSPRDQSLSVYYCSHNRNKHFGTGQFFLSVAWLASVFSGCVSLPECSSSWSLYRKWRLWLYL